MMAAAAAAVCYVFASGWSVVRLRIISDWREWTHLDLHSYRLVLFLFPSCLVFAELALVQPRSGISRCVHGKCDVRVPPSTVDLCLPRLRPSSAV